MKKESKKIKRTKFEEKEFRRLQKAIAALPKPSFNNPEKAQPAKEVTIPKIVPATLNNSPSFVSSDEKAQKLTDSPIILDTNSKRIESVARIKKPKAKSTILRTLGYLKKYWYLLALAVLFAIINSVFEIFIPILIGRGIDYIVGPDQVQFDMIIKYIIYLSICVVGFAVFKWLLSRVANGMAYKVEEQMHNDIFKKFNKNRFYCKKSRILIGIYIRNTRGGERDSNQEQLYFETKTT